MKKKQKEDLKKEAKSSKSESNKRELKRKVIFFSIILTLFSVGLIDSFALFFSDRIVPRVTLNGIDLSAKTKVGVEKILEEKSKETEEKPVEFTFEEKNFSILPVDIDFKTDFSASAEKAFSYGHKERILWSVKEVLRALLIGVEVLPVYSFDKLKLEEKIEAIAKETDQPESEANIQVKAGKVEILEGKDGQRIDKKMLEKEILDQLAGFYRKRVALSRNVVHPKVAKDDGSAENGVKNIIGSDLKLVAREKSLIVRKRTIEGWISGRVEGNSLVPDIDDSKVGAFLEKYAEDLETQPENAKLKIENGQVSVITDGKPGQVMDKEAAKKRIKEALLARVSDAHKNPQISINLKEVEASVSAKTVGDLNIKELIGKATTSFAGSPKNRRHNISTGVSFLSGIVIAPGQEFSTMKLLGRIDGSTGYLPELVIKVNKTVPEFGGGLCQVSTTLFRAALNSGLPITERANHRYRVSYYEAGVGPGLDATIYDPKPDLRFKNDTPGYILIQGYTEGNNITFEIYGTKDGRESRIEGPYILSTTPPPPPERINTDTLPKGTEKKVESEHPGAVTTATYIVTRNGKEINRQVFNSSYIPWQARYLVGTAETPPPAEAAPAD